MCDTTVYMNKEPKSGYTQVFGLYYLRRLIDENHDKVLRFDGSIYIDTEYLDTLEAY
jgi:hypothetical protein